MIYTDYIGSKITDASYGGTHNFYSENLPDNGNYCIDWKGFNQYNTTSFNFKPDKDLSKLVSEGYSLDFMVRGNAAGIKFDMRFIDTKTGDTDHPWRIRFVIDQTVAAWDKKWHHVNIGLDTFTEHGSWDNGSWYNPAGLYDWTNVDRFEFSTEYAGPTGWELWFDNIHVTNRDTAVVRESGTVGIHDNSESDLFFLKVWPNPFSTQAGIYFRLDAEMPVSIKIMSVNGTVVRNILSDTRPEGLYDAIWDGCNQGGAELPAGIYLCVLTTPAKTIIRKIIKG